MNENPKHTPSQLNNFIELTNPELLKKLKEKFAPNYNPNATKICLLQDSPPPTIEPLDAYAHASLDLSNLIHCELCQGQTFISYYNDKGYKLVKPCPGALKLKRIERFNNAKIPARYAKATFESFNTKMTSGLMTHTIKELQSYLDRFTPGMNGRVLIGPPGTGKTHILIAMLRILTLEKSIDCRYIEFSHLLSEIRKIYNTEERKSESDIIEPLVQIPVLAIDELGKGKCNEFELRIIDELISRRYNNTNLTTFCASNYYFESLIDRKIKGNENLESLEMRISQQTASRLHEMCTIQTLDSKDYRAHLQHYKR